jgi:hypothetical protein
MVGREESQIPPDDYNQDPGLEEALRREFEESSQSGEEQPVESVSDESLGLLFQVALAPDLEESLRIQSQLRKGGGRVVKGEEVIIFLGDGTEFRQQTLGEPVIIGEEN